MKRLPKMGEHLSPEFTIGFKCRVITRLRMGLTSESEICKQHEISVNLLRDWSRWYERHFGQYNQITRPMTYELSSSDPQGQIAELQEQLKQSYHSHQAALLKAEAWKIIVQIASEELEVDIEKKYGSGQLPA